MIEQDVRLHEQLQLRLLQEESLLKGRQRAERYPGRQFFGFFCSYWPEELVLASGLEPLRLLPASGSAIPAELPAYSCSLARGCLALAACGEYGDLAGVGFAHTCDTMQSLGGIWRATVPQPPVLVMVPPVTLDAAGAAQYFKSELADLCRQLAELTGRQISSGDLRQALDLCNRIRRLVRELDEMRPNLPSPLVSAVLRAGQVMPREEYAMALNDAMPVLREMAADPATRRRLLVSGAVLEDDSLFRMLEDLGGRVVADDTCTGYRHYLEPIEAGSSDPLEAIVRRFTGMAPCPCRSLGLDRRMDYLVQLARERQAQGALLVIRKYCEPHAWDSVPLAERLKSAGIRTLVLELEASEVGGQERTRLQAFLESL